MAANLTIKYMDKIATRQGVKRKIVIYVKYPGGIIVVKETNKHVNDGGKHYVSYFKRSVEDCGRKEDCRRCL